jgi:hypothetical protein
MIRHAGVFAVLLFAGLAVGQDFNTPQTELRPINVATGFNEPNPGGVWKMSPAAKHHRAIVRVNAGNQGGSGSVVAIDGPGMVVITNHHVIEGHDRATVSSEYGSSGTMPVIWASEQLDLAVLYHPQGSWEYTLPIAGDNPPIGSQLEMAGYGGPTNELRHFFAKRLQPRYNPIEIEAATVSGDSGCPIMYGGAICGVNFGSTGGQTLGSVNDSGGPWRLNYPACSRVDGPKLAEVLTQVCSPLGCRPRIIRRGGPPAIVIPPPSTAAPPQSQPPEHNGFANPQTPDPCVACPPGPQGPPGPAGKDGAQGPPGPAATPQGLRVLLVDGATKQVLDDETYAPGEPIVLDVRNILNPSRNK